MYRNIFVAIFVLIILCGCGYTTHSVLPPDQSSIHVDNFINKIKITDEISNKKIYYAYKPGMEANITREVIDRFIFDGNLEIRETKQAHFLLKGQLVDFRREPLRYDANDNVIEYRISIAVNLELYDLTEGKILWREENFAGESTYRTTGQFAKSESVAIQEATEDLARRIVERTVENW